MNQVREAENNPDRAVHAGALFAMGLIDEASHMVIARYREQYDRNVMADALAFFGEQTSPEALDRLLLTFVEHFPGQSVMRGDQTAQQWLRGATNGVPHREAALEELLLLWTANRNEAFQPFEELFAEKPLAEQTVYRQVTQKLPEYFATRPLIPLPGARPMNLVELLRAPAAASPKSLREQLDLVRQMWKPLIGDALDRHPADRRRDPSRRRTGHLDAVQHARNDGAARGGGSGAHGGARRACSNGRRLPAPRRCPSSAIPCMSTRSSRPTRRGCRRR